MGAAAAVVVVVSRTRSHTCTGLLLRRRLRSLARVVCHGREFRWLGAMAHVFALIEFRAQKLCAKQGDRRKTKNRRKKAKKNLQ